MFLLAAVGTIMKSELVRVPNFTSTATRGSFFIFLATLVKQEQCLSEPTINVSRILFLLVRLTHLVSNNNVTNQVIPALVQRFISNPKHLHVCVPYLTSIAVISEDMAIFQEVVQLLADAYKGCIGDNSNRFNQVEIPQAFLGLAQELSNSSESSLTLDPYLCGNMMNVLLKILLKLYCDVARNICTSHEYNDYKSEAYVLGVLLPVLALLMQPWNEYGYDQCILLLFLLFLFLLFCFCFYCFVFIVLFLFSNS